jgi:hypothetical protein
LARRFSRGEVEVAAGIFCSGVEARGTGAPWGSIPASLQIGLAGLCRILARPTEIPQGEAGTVLPLPSSTLFGRGLAGDD